MKNILSAAFLFLLTSAYAQTDKTAAAEKSDLKRLTSNKDQKVWMLTYFRQRYPTRIEIDAKGNILEKYPYPILFWSLN